MNRDDIRSMLSRENLISAHGIDVNEWPSLRDAAKPKPRRLPMPLAFQSHRGEGGIPRTAPEPEALVLDWGVRRPAETPPPAQRPRARSASPERRRFGDVVGVIKDQPLYQEIRPLVERIMPTKVELE